MNRRKATPLLLLLFTGIILPGAVLSQCPPLVQSQVPGFVSSAGDRFGYDIAVSGDRAAVSASLYDVPGPDTGAIVPLTFDPFSATWQLFGTDDPLTVPGLNSGAGGAGVEVDVEGDWIVAGFRHHDAVGFWSGSAFLWHYDGASSQWQLTQNLVGSTAAILDEAGSVSISGEWIALGAGEADPLATASGIVWIFRHDQTTDTFNESHILVAPGGQLGDQFGSALGLDGDRIAVSAPYVDGGTGQVFIFQYDEALDEWLLEQAINAPDADVSALFGASLELQGDRLIVGAPGHLDVGQAYLFERDPATGIWNHTTTLADPDGNSGDQFGFSVTVSGPELAIGAVASDLAAPDAGAVHSFSQDSATGQWNAVDVSMGSFEGDALGRAVAISGPFLIMGAPLSDQDSPNGGAIRIQYAGETDCNGDTLTDGCQIAEDPSLDCDEDGIIDSCQIAADPTLDCNGNQTLDICDVAQGAPDCNDNGIPDGCDTDLDPSLDCDGNSAIDICEIASDPGLDCDESQSLDICDLAAGFPDCDGDAILDSCQIAADPTLDCDFSGALDSCELASGAVSDCDGNGLPDPCDVSSGNDGDCDGDGELDGCAVAAGAEDCDGNGVPDSCQPDCNGNGLADPCDIAAGTVLDCNDNGVPDGCDFESGSSVDCNGNGFLDDCEIAQGFAEDCDGDGAIDLCQIAAGAADCNENLLLDSCDIASGSSNDADGSGIPDECEDTPFIRGECNGDDAISIADAIFLLSFLFNGGAASTCQDASDLNDDGGIDIGDAVNLLSYLFIGASDPAAPFPACGLDPTDDSLGCESFSVCP